MGGARILRTIIGAAAVAAASAASWLGWLGWDTQYYYDDPEVGAYQGPHRPWQVAGCALSLLAVAVLGGLLLRWWLVAAAMTVSFSALWIVQAAATDSTGLWAVGAAMLVTGLGLGSAAVSAGAGVVRRRRAAAR